MWDLLKFVIGVILIVAILFLLGVDLGKIIDQYIVRPISYFWNAMVSLFSGQAFQGIGDRTKARQVIPIEGE